MPPTRLVDLDRIDLNRLDDDIEGIRRQNAQRSEMEMLTGIIRYDPEENYAIGYKETSSQDFWVKGHIPGRPLMPGVLICECAAQLCSYYYSRAEQKPRFFGFAGLDGVKFRGQVFPGDRLIMVAKLRRLKSRISTFDCQGFVNGRMVFEGTVSGMAM